MVDAGTTWPTHNTNDNNNTRDTIREREMLFFFSSGLARDAHSNHLSDNVTLFFIVVIGTVLYSISYGNSVLTPKADSFLSFCKSRCREA